MRKGELDKMSLSTLFSSFANYYNTYSYNTGSSSSAAGGVVAGLMIFYVITILAVAAYSIIVQWKIFTKAGREGWKALIPFYNAYVLTEIAGYNGLLFLIMLIPGGALVWQIMVALKLAPAFGKDTGFAIGLILLAPIFQGILAFGKAQYVGPQGGAAPAAGATPAAGGSATPAAPAAGAGNADANASSLTRDPWLNGQQ